MENDRACVTRTERSQQASPLSGTHSSGVTHISSKRGQEPDWGGSVCVSV